MLCSELVGHTGLADLLTFEVRVKATEDVAALVDPLHAISHTVLAVDQNQLASNLRGTLTVFDAREHLADELLRLRGVVFEHDSERRGNKLPFELRRWDTID